MAADSPGECGDAELFEALRKRIFAESEEEEEEAPFIAPPVEAPEEEEDLEMMLRRNRRAPARLFPPKRLANELICCWTSWVSHPTAISRLFCPEEHGVAPEERKDAWLGAALTKHLQLKPLIARLSCPEHELRTRSLARAALADGTTAPSLAAVEAELEEGRATTHDRPASPGALEDRLRWLSEELRGDLKPRGLKSLADREEAPYKVMALLGKAFAKNAKPSGRKLIFYLCNELCRPTVKAPTNGHSKLLRHAVWGFLKAMTACTTDLTDDERSHFVRFLRRHSSSTDEASFIWRAAGEGKDAHDWQRRLTQWEAALMTPGPSIFASTFGTTAAMRDAEKRCLVPDAESEEGSILNEPKAAKHFRSIRRLWSDANLQDRLRTYQLYVSTVEGLFSPFAHGLQEQIQVLDAALRGQRALNDDPIQKEALDLCVKQHSMGFIHLMVLSLWGAKLMTEVSESLNRLTILCLVEDPEQNNHEPHIQERGDRKMIIAYMTWKMKIVVIIVDIVPRRSDQLRKIELICTMFLMWTGGELFMLTHTMGSLRLGRVTERFAIIPLLTLTYILTIPTILFTGFSSFKFKEKVEWTQYQYRSSARLFSAELVPQGLALCYTQKNCQMWGLTVIKAVATFLYVYMIYAVVFGNVTAYRNLCTRYLGTFPQGRCNFRCHLGIAH
eukprot:g18052.t1